MSEAVVMQRKLLGMQICCPKDWTDEQVREFAEKDSPCGTTCGWQVNEEMGRIPCENAPDKIHVVVIA